MAAAPPGEFLPFKQMANVLFAEDGKIKNSGKCALIIDANDNPMAATFLRYRDLNMVDASGLDLSPERLRLALLGALRFGKSFVLDLGNNPDLLDKCSAQLDEVKSGLMELVLNNKITEENQFSQIVRKTDPPEYSINSNHYLVENYKFILLTTNPQVSPDLLDKTYPLHIVM